MNTPDTLEVRSDFRHGALLGFITGLLLALIVRVAVIVKRFRQNDIYDLDHWKLHLDEAEMPTWMNMGYWASDTSSLEEAGQELLMMVLRAASINRQGDKHAKLAFLDLGIGCGDQTHHLARHIAGAWDKYYYVGLTLNPTHLLRASSQLKRHASRDPLLDKSSIRVFQADAARPETWAQGIHDALESLRAKYSDDDERWVLALDCLYHFFPSRQPVFAFAAKHLDASLMAFDLILNEAASSKERLIVKFLSVAMKCPTGAFMTEAAYRRQLQQAGYNAKEIQFKDITDGVFAGLAGHIERRGKSLEPYGISMGKYKVAGKMFGWLAKTRALKAVVIVARRKPKTA